MANDNIASVVIFKNEQAKEIQFFKDLLAGKLLAQPQGSPSPGNRWSAPTKSVPSIHRPVPPISTTAESADASLGKCERSILAALAQYHPHGRTAVQVALLAEYSVNSGGFNNSLGKLRSLGYITRSNPIQITEEGRANAGSYKELPTGLDLAGHWIQKLAKCEATILQFLTNNYPQSFTSQQVGEAVGYSPTSGGFNNALGRLRTLELITRGQPMKASKEFFQ
jgi:hypothetical protein